MIVSKGEYSEIDPRNTAQLQGSLSISAFLAAYGTEEQCEDALFAARWPVGLSCPACGGEKFYRLGCRRAVFHCNRCKRQISRLAGTIFAAAKLPLTKWFLATYLLTQAKNGISALELGRQVGVSANTAWLVRHELMQAMLQRDAGHKLKGEVQVDDAHLGAEHAGGKRVRGAENKTPFVAAVQVSEGGHPVVMKLTVIEGFRKAAAQRWAEENVQPGTKVHTDGLGCFRGFGAAGSSTPRR